MNDLNAHNQQVIKEFRATGGKMEGPFAGQPVLLLHTVGAKSGQERVNPVMYQPVGQHMAVFASKAGAPTNPDWYHNLLAHPEATVEVGAQTVRVNARVAQGAERDELWERQKAENSQFAEYEGKTDRQIPVVVLERA